MTKSARAALIAAHTFLSIERIRPGGRTTTAFRIRHDKVKQTAELMADKLDENASPEERRAFLNDMDAEGHEFLRPVEGNPPDVHKMTGPQRHYYADELALKRKANKP